MPKNYNSEHETNYGTIIDKMNDKCKKSNEKREIFNRSQDSFS